MGHVYFLLHENGLVKIGHTTNVERRVAQQRGPGRAACLLGTVEGSPHDERRIHALFGDYRISGRRKRYQAPELFALPSHLIDGIRQQCMLLQPKVTKM